MLCIYIYILCISYIYIIKYILYIYIYHYVCIYNIYSSHLLLGSNLFFEPLQCRLVLFLLHLVLLQVFIPLAAGHKLVITPWMMAVGCSQQRHWGLENWKPEMPMVDQITALFPYLSHMFRFFEWPFLALKIHQLAPPNQLPLEHLPSPRIPQRLPWTTPVGKKGQPATGLPIDEGIHLESSLDSTILIHF